MTDDRTRRNRLSWSECTTRIGAALAAIYLPYLSLLFVGGKSDYRWFVFEIWPVAPGLVIRFMSRSWDRTPSDYERLATIVCTLTVVGVVITLALEARVAWRIIVVVFAISSLIAAFISFVVATGSLAGG